MEPKALVLDPLTGPWSGRWRQDFREEGRDSLDLVFQQGQLLNLGIDSEV